jgi:hypothetical protein
MRSALLSSAIAVLAFATPAAAQNGTQAGTLELYPTFQSVGVRLGYSGDLNLNGTAHLEWRRTGASTWTVGVPMARINGSREYALATQKVTYDAASVAQYAEAVVAGNEPLQAFLRASIIRPEFLPKLDEWQAYIDETGKPPPNLVEDTDYLGALFAKSNQYDDAALAASLEGDEAGRNADDYIVTTLFMASALFFAGVTASFSSRMTRIMLLAASALTLGYAAARIAGYPIA